MILNKTPTLSVMAPSSTCTSQPRAFTSVHTNKQVNSIFTAKKCQRAATLRAVAPRSGVVVAALRNFDWPEALLFDCDGVLVDTEAEGHRVAFNEAFTRKGLPHQWGLEQYGELLETGRLPVRPGVSRLINEAIDAGVKVAVCSTSNERAVSNIVRVMLGEKIASHMRVFAGDMVPKKKPAPDIYLMAAKEYEVDPARCVVIEDSRIGLAAGKAAGMRVIVTESYYTKGEDFSIADAVFDCIGEAGDERFSLHDLTTPGSFWLNPPLPMDEQGNWVGPTAPKNQQQQEQKRSNGSGGVENVELLVGDMLAQVSFATYKQIIGIALSPQFEGWLAPLHFNPIRFEEFFGFVVTICGTWAAAGILLGAYTNEASADVRSALVATCRVWIASMCIAAAQLVLVTAAEDGALVGTEGWGRALPLAASLPGEPFISAAQILGLMLIWRSFYAAYLDMSKFLKFGGARLDMEIEAQHFKDALKTSVIIAAASCVCLHFLSTGFLSGDGGPDAILLLNF
ncbi:hypothetical protein Ndes2526A_g00995 [Nannochloris sp. 'desiccata']